MTVAIPVTVAAVGPATAACQSPEPHREPEVIGSSPSR